MKRLSIYTIKIISKYCNISYLHFSIPLYEKYKINWISLSQNTNIPFTFFEKHLDKISWY